jgi:very-short-patch-repair endonuclease
MIDDRRRLSGMLNFAAEILAARETVRFDMASGGGMVLREEAIAHLPGIHLGGDDAWMRVVRMRETPPPALPKHFEDWLDGAIAHPDRTPRLHTERMVQVEIETASDLVEAGLATCEACHPIQEDDPETGEVRVSETEVLVHLKLDRLDEFRAAFDEWVAVAWIPWAREESPRRKSIRIYQALFKLHSMMQVGAGSSAFELVWGIGVARWRKRDQQPILDLPLIEQLADIELEESGDLVIRPRLVRPQLVMAPYLALDVPQAHQAQVALEPMLRKRHEDPDVVLSPFDPFTYEDILQAAAARLTESGRYVPRCEIAAGDEVAEPAPDLAIYGLWAIYARPRSEHVRREDLQVMARKVEQAEGEDAIPEPLRGFVRHLQTEEPAEDNEFRFDPGFFGQHGRSETGWGSSKARGKGAASTSPGSGQSRRRAPYFFPLPYNEEQARIIDMLEEKGVAVVTGPPGTGKSHTIANIIAHYMATDRRVLVTAKTAEAISVVQDKLPESIGRLTIAVVHSDREGAKQLEDAISAMSKDARAVDRNDTLRRIQELESRVVATEEAAAEIDSKLGAIARANLQPISYRARDMLPMDLAETLREEREAHGWFVDRPRPGALASLPEGAVEEIRVLRRRLGRDLVYLGQDRLLDPDDLPGARELIEANRQAAEIHGRPVDDFAGAPMMVRDDASAEDRGRALAAALMETDGWLMCCAPWVRELYRAEVARMLPGAGEEPEDFARLRSAIEWLKGFVRATEPYRPGICEWPATLSDAEEFWRAVADLARGHQPIGLMARLFRRDLKAALDSVRVQGVAPALPEHWSVVQETRRWRDAYRAFLPGWPGAPALPELPGVEADPAEVRAALDAVLDCVREVELQARRAPELADEARALFIYGLTIDDAFRQADHAKVRWALRANLPDDVIRHPALDTLERAATAGTGPIYDLLAKLLVVTDGPALEPADIVEARNMFAAELVRLQGRMPDLRRLETLLGTLDATGAPAWAVALTDPDRAEGDLLPESWCAAWEWAEAMGKIQAIHGLEDADALRQTKAELMRERHRLFEELILARTLFSLNRRIGRVHTALTNFTQAIRRLGRGTGREAPRWRAEIRRAAMEAAPAAPVWIMPEHKVSEQLPKQISDFDLVILDEASQSDITALAALARGKRLLIVGDDEQVSPTAIGVTSEKVAELRTRFLAELHHRNMIDAESSIFDLAQMMFPQGQIMLREHFRSVAPIIAFSSQFYQGGLIPLRVPKPSERLDPPLIDIYLPEGERERGRNVNPDEAAVIVEEIARMVADPAMAGRSIGVISLIGRHQAEVIERALMESPDVGLEKMQAHRIICGDSSSLQGQERDIVLLSMVADRAHARVMADRKAAQRFNVAMSRARDRLYLVRSVARSHLAHADLKHKVIAHFREPLPDGAKVVDASLVGRCQSGFEREVCGRLLEAGYRAIPQMKVGARSIDLVVEGAEDRRLAIELDGDRFHGPERWEEDMARQAALERAGWVFWRVFGSQWKADPDYWWRRLVERLEQCGIAPIGSAAVNEIYTEHRVIRAGAEPVIVADPEGVTWTVAPVAETVEGPDEKVAAPASESETEPVAGPAPAPAIPPLPARLAVVAPPEAARPAATAAPNQQGMLPGFGEEGPLSQSRAADETSFHLEETQPEIVRPDMAVVLFYPENRKRRTIRISSREDAPDDNVIHMDRPLAQALIGATIDETIELEVSGKTIRVVVERIFPEVEAAE